MARPQENGIDYFPLNVDFFDDKENIKPIISQFGADGISLLIYLYCDIYKNGFYSKVNDDFIYIASMDLRMNHNKIRQMLNNFLIRSLFDKTLYQTVKVLTAPGIQKRYQLAIKERVRKRKNPVIVDRNIWLIPENEIEEISVKVNNVSTLIKVISFYDIPRNNLVFPRNNAVYPLNNQQSKVKESNYYIYKAIIDRLNEKCSASYRNDSSKTMQLIDEKISSGYTVEDFFKVIDKKASEWIKTEWQQYLTPDTLFGNKFEKYLNQKMVVAHTRETKRKPENKFHNFPQRNYSENYYTELESNLLKKKYEQGKEQEAQLSGK
ncbi:MAG: conserved phage C-terminal domain-containing protein [Velocimicrobium sp.]